MRHIKKTFAEKYGLVGKGKPVVISQKSKDLAKALSRQAAANRAMDDYIAKHDTTLYR